MAKSDTLPIFLDAYKLLLELYQTTAKFTHEHKYALGQDIKKDSLELLRLIYQANHHKNKAPYLENFMSVFEVLKLELRLCYDINAISLKKNVHLSLIMEQIGRQAAAWKKHEEKNSNKGENAIY